MLVAFLLNGIGETDLNSLAGSFPLDPMLTRT